ncbi:hypothetical protein N7451_004743 [Penicillium sp. IBT 35674x]|nr:hypothetical protein N7451_004743 [Penicillium sp. IBT 35674x]
MERGVFRFLKWQELYNVERPFQILIDLPKDVELKQTTNMEFEEGPEVTIMDVRAVEICPHIDTHGFTYASHDSRLMGDHLLNKANVESIYLPECETLLRMENFPLALCDGRTVSPTARVESDRIRRKYTGGTTFVLQEPEQKWYYLSQQQVNEVAIFKNFDSQCDVTQYAPHSSFVPLAHPLGNRPRQSIEVRAMVFTYAPDDHF